MATAASEQTDLDLQALDRVQRRVLWLAAAMADALAGFFARHPAMAHEERGARV